MMPSMRCDPVELIAELPQSIATVLPISVAHDLVYNVPSQSTAFETNLCKKKPISCFDASKHGENSRGPASKCCRAVVGVAARAVIPRCTGWRWECLVLLRC